METLEVILEDHKYQFEYVTEQIDIPQPLYVFYIKPKSLDIVTRCLLQSNYILLYRHHQSGKTTVFQALQ